MICPYCGGKNDDSAHFCAWCQAELVDTSTAETQLKKSQLINETQELKQLPLHVAKIISIVVLSFVLVFGIGGTIFCISTGHSFSELPYITMHLKTTYLESRLAHCYASGNYKGLYKLVVDGIDDTFDCKGYDSYSGVLIAHYEGIAFDEGQNIYQTGTTEKHRLAGIVEMCVAYSKLTDEKYRHNESLDTDRLIPSLEDDLSAEISRQGTYLSSILDYDFSTLYCLPQSEIEKINWKNYLKE